MRRQPDEGKRMFNKRLTAGAAPSLSAGRQSAKPPNKKRAAV